MSVHRRIVLCLFVGALFLAAIPSVQAQKPRADSLARVLKSMRKDTARVTVLIALANARLATQQADAAERTAREALALSQKLRSDPKVAESWLAIARCRLQNKDYDGAANAAETALRSAQKRGDAQGVAFAFVHLGTIEFNRKQFAKAVEYDIRAAEQYGLAGDADMSAYNYGIAGVRLNERSKFAEAVPVLEKSLEIRERLGVPAKLAVAHDRLGQSLAGLGKYLDAIPHGEAAVRLYGQHKQESKLAWVYGWLAQAYQNTNAPDKARECVARMIDLGEILGNNAITAEAFLLQGMILQRIQIDSARAAYDRARQHYEAAGNDRGVSNTLKLIGELSLEKGHKPQAREYLIRSLAAAERSRQNGKFVLISPTLISLGNAASDLDEAGKYYRKALVAAKEDNAPPYVFTTALYSIGKNEYEAGKDSLALSTMRGVRGKARSEGDWDRAIGTYCVEGLIHQRQRKLDSAEADFETTLELAREHGAGQWERQASLSLGRIFEKRGQLTRAMDMYYSVLRMYEKRGETVMIAGTLNDIARIQNELKLYDDAHATLRRSLTLSRDLDPPSTYTTALYTQGLVFTSQRDHRAALASLSQAFALLEKSHKFNGMAIMAAAMSKCYYALDLRKEAREMFQRSFALRDSAGGGGCTVCELLDHATFLIKEGQAREAVDLLLEWQASDAGKHEDASTQGQILEQLSNAYSECGDHVQAMQSFKRAVAIRDSIYTLEQSKIIADHSAKYDAERREQQIALLEKDKAISALSLQKQAEELLRRSVEAERDRQRIQLLSKNQQLQELELDRRNAAFEIAKAHGERQSKQVALLEKEKQLAASVLARQQMLRNSLIGGMLLIGALAFVGVRRIQGRRREATLRAESAEYKAQALQAEALERERAVRQQFARHLIDSQEHERKRLAGELHDELGQELLIIKFRAQLALAKPAIDTSHLREIIETADNAIANVRKVSRDLRPYQLERAGLSATLRSMLETVARSTEMTLTAEIDDVDGLIDREREIDLYRVVQEGVNNILKHSGAATASVHVRRAGNALEIRVSDDGRGFDTRMLDGARSIECGLGMQGMNERVEMLGGRMEVRSAPGRGTTLFVRVPTVSAEATVS